MEVTLNDELQKALTAFLMEQGPWVAVAVIFVFMLPKIIPALSSAIAEQRKVTHKRQDNQRKIKNAAAQRAATTPQSKPKSGGTGA